ncbi:hypothetical protein GCM10023194_79140 [Planotetraspora phitsanulokensis]|uniref:Uncharacterized protein n=1 Tax=Planotetraspora phitsanulokensis TaxID=575192 RepID=A0A8J3UR48_9ACTN|nr:hypothetical protein [Planotetraspora phitsanulokensis]GII43125.1 hypothetical protein Pph01_81280 [Planotetraspora phitsanulokensis]
MIERADQLVLEFVSRVADAAHGRLRPEQRLDFVQRLRAGVERERGGSEDARYVAKVIAGFGTPADLIDREVRRLAAAQQAAQQAADPASRQDARPVGAGDTAVFPVVADDAEPHHGAHPEDGDRRLPPGVIYGRRIATERITRRADRPAPLLRLRRAAMAGGNPMATGGRDARTIFLNNRRETMALALLVVAGLLVPFRLPTLAIFPIPAIVWAAAALTLLACQGWSFSDRLIGLTVPVLAYAVGGVLLGAARSEGGTVQAFMVSFHNVSGVLFILGTAAAVSWLAFRLLDPPHGENGNNRR